MGPFSARPDASPYECASPVVATEPSAFTSQKPLPDGVENPFTTVWGQGLAVAAFAGGAPIVNATLANNSPATLARSNRRMKGTPRSTKKLKFQLFPSARVAK